MKKIKSIWQNNKIIFVLLIILIVCFIAIVSVALTYFVGSEKSPYGNRLDDMVEFNNEQKDLVVETLEGDSSVLSASVRKSIRTIYVSVLFKDDITLDSAKEKIGGVIDLFSEDVLSYYDINFILKNETNDENKKFNIMGCRNSNGNGIYWNNNTLVEEESE